MGVLSTIGKWAFLHIIHTIHGGKNQIYAGILRTVLACGELWHHHKSTILNPPGLPAMYAYPPDKVMSITIPGISRM